MKPAILVAGIGSPHGDDRAGWFVIDRLGGSVTESCSLRKIKVPHELLDYIDQVDVLHLVDAYAAESSGSRIVRYELTGGVESPSELRFELAGDPSEAVGNSTAVAANPRSDTSHHIDLVSVLRLMGQLKRLPRRVTLWAVPGKRFEADVSLSAACEAGAIRCAKTIRQELDDA